MHVGDLEDYMVGADGADVDTFERTDGPFGFGYAIKVESENEECLVKGGYSTEGDCTQDPNLCSKGFSISIWEKAEFSYDIFWTINSMTSEPKRYVLSTGGDEQGHPGIAIYHQGISLVALVSTGFRFWKLQVYGPFDNATWNNIGILWSMPLGDAGGLEMHVNQRRVGSVWKSEASTRKEPLNPPEIMLGCHRDSDNTAYRGFNDAEFDELAMWKRSLLSNETMYFLGGYEGEMDQISPEEYQVMLEKTDLSDPEQLGIAFSVLSAMKVTPPEGNDTAETSRNSTIKLQEVMSSLTNPSNIKHFITVDQWKKYMNLIEGTSNLLALETKDDWKSLEAQGKPGATKVARDFEGFYFDLLNKVQQPGGAKLSSTRTTENIAARSEKTRIRDFMASGKTYVTPDYTQMKSIFDDWDQPMDKAHVPTQIFTDIRCMDRPMSILTVLYNTYDDVGPSSFSSKTLNPNMPNYLDSRVMSIRMRGVPDVDGEGMLIPESPDCLPDPEVVRKLQIKIVLEHNVKERALRRLLFHDDEPKTKINYRHCVRWNNDEAVWDSTGCTVEESTATFTRCTCKGFGTYAVVAEEIEPIVVNELSDGTVMIIRIGYFVSLICLVFYMAVIGVSGDLKDQAHLVGFNLAGCLLLGDVMMLLVSFLPDARSDRHSCAILGTFIHAFFLTAGGWVAMMGHTSFKTITAGVIGGKLKAYFFLSWGVSIGTIGLTYLAFMRFLGTDPRCFISWTNEVKGVFFVPQLGYCGAAIFFACIVFFNLGSAAQRKGNILVDYKSYSIGASILIIYFSLTWSLGCAAYIRWGTDIPDLYPVFEILNSFMGLILLICIGFASRKYRLFLTGQYKKKREQLNNYKNKGGDKEVLAASE